VKDIGRKYKGAYLAEIVIADEMVIAAESALVCEI
jgi:hypothetical protein